MLHLLKNKKVIMLLIGILLIPVIVPILEILINCLFYIGKYLGTFVRGLMEVGIC